MCFKIRFSKYVRPNLQEIFNLAFIRENEKIVPAIENWSWSNSMYQIVDHKSYQILHPLMSPKIHSFGYGKKITSSLNQVATLAFFAMVKKK